MDYEKLLPNKIMNRIFEGTEHEVNIAKLSRAMRRPTPSIWNKISHKRRWDFQTFIEVLWVMGYGEYRNNRIQLKVPLEPKEVKRLNRLRSDVLVHPPETDNP